MNELSDTVLYVSNIVLSQTDEINLGFLKKYTVRTSRGHHFTANMDCSIAKLVFKITSRAVFGVLKAPLWLHMDTPGVHSVKLGNKSENEIKFIQAKL